MFKQFVGFLKLSANIVRKGKSMADAADDDTDNDGVPQYIQLKNRFPVMKDKVVEAAKEVVDVAILAWAYFLHIVEAGEDGADKPAKAGG